MSKKVIIRKRPDQKYVSIKLPSRTNSFWLTMQEYETLRELLKSDNGFDQASANLIVQPKV
jgi:hypothetical protein